MTYVDFGILAIVLVSCIISVVRGFVKEAISLATWVLAFWVSFMFSDKLASLLPAGLEAPTLRWALSFIALFLATLLVGGLTNFLLSTFVQRSGLSGTDRSLGIVFGFLRGVVVVIALVLLAGRTTVPQEAWWRDSLLIAPLERLAVLVTGVLPDDVGRNFVFSLPGRP